MMGYNNLSKTGPTLRRSVLVRQCIEKRNKTGNEEQQHKQTVLEIESAGPVKLKIKCAKIIYLAITIYFTVPFLGLPRTARVESTEPQHLKQFLEKNKVSSITWLNYMLEMGLWIRNTA